MSIAQRSAAVVITDRAILTLQAAQRSADREGGRMLAHAIRHLVTDRDARLLRH